MRLGFQQLYANNDSTQPTLRSIICLNNSGQDCYQDYGHPLHIGRLIMTQQDAKYKQFEEALLKETDLLIEKAESQGEKALYNLFKSAVLKKYKDQYDVEILQGEVKKETVEKSIDFLFEDACFRFRALPKIEDSIKDDSIKRAQSFLVSWKAMFIQTLVDNGLEVIFQ